MNAEDDQTGGILLAVGLITQYALTIFIMLIFHSKTAATICWFLGWVMFLAGFCMLARARGRSLAWGLLGLLSWFGLVVLLLLPERPEPNGVPIELSAPPKQ